MGSDISMLHIYLVSGFCPSYGGPNRTQCHRNWISL